MREKGFAIKGSTLKWIAIITMLIDHTGATLVAGALSSCPQGSTAYQRWLFLYWLMRCIGRIAFPIFCYLLVEGIRHTSNPRKYAARLLLFALISELPFDYAFFSGWIDWNGQNVFFTLFLGFVAVECTLYIQKNLQRPVVKQFGNLLVTVVFMIAADYLYTDYGAIGVLTIVLMYYVPVLRPRGRKGTSFLIAMLPLVVANPVELPALLDAVLIQKYDGTRGKQMKYFFYLFYPVHILLLGILYHFIFT